MVEYVSQVLDALTCECKALSCIISIVCNYWLKYRDSKILMGSCRRVYSIAYEILNLAPRECTQHTCRKHLQVNTPDPLAPFAEMNTAFVDKACLVTLGARGISTVSQDFAQTGEQQLLALAHNDDCPPKACHFCHPGTTA
jgi:hypothetical protein